MALPVTIELPTTEGTLYTAPDRRTAILVSIHVANESGGARTFTIKVAKPGDTARPISPVNQALATDAMAVYAETLHLPGGHTLRGVADGANVSCTIIGKEVRTEDYDVEPGLG